MLPCVYQSKAVNFNETSEGQKISGKKKKDKRKEKNELK